MSLERFPQCPLPPSHSQAPLIITSGRPIVILPNEYFHAGRDFPPGAILSTAFNFGRQSDFCDSGPPPPVITPTDDDDSPSLEHIAVPAAQFSEVKAIEFATHTFQKERQCVVPGQPDAETHKKEESTLTAAKPVTPDLSYASSRWSLDQLQQQQRTPSPMGVPPLIMSCYEESKEQLVLDDSDSELEMSDCGKSDPGTPLENSKQLCTFENLAGDDPRTKVQPSREESVANDESSYEPPPKRAKVDVTYTKTSNPACDEHNRTPAGSGKLDNNMNNCGTIAAESSATVGILCKSFGQTVPNQLPLSATHEPLEVAEVTKTSPILSTIVYGQDVKWQCPREPTDVANVGKEPEDQMLPMECAREHAMVPNLARCSDDSDHPSDDRDRPNDDGSRGTRLDAYVPATDPQLESIEHHQVRTSDNLVPAGHAVIELSVETHAHVSKLLDNNRHQCDSVDINILAKPQLPFVVESDQLTLEHQIVPEDFASNNAPQSSQSLYQDYDCHQKDKLGLQNESNVVEDELDNCQRLAVSMESIEKRWNSVGADLSRPDDQALPESPSQLNHCHTDGSPAGADTSYEMGSDVQRGCSGQGFGPFGFRIGKHAPSSQGKSKNCV